MNISKEIVEDCFKNIDLIIQNEGKLQLQNDNITRNINLKKRMVKILLKKNNNTNTKNGTIRSKLVDDYDEAYNILYTVRKSENKKEAESQLKEYIGDQYEYADHYFTKYNELSEEEQQNNKYNNFIKTAIEIKFPDEVDYNVNDYDDDEPSSREIITNAREKVMPKELKESKPPSSLLTRTKKMVYNLMPKFSQKNAKKNLATEVEVKPPTSSKNAKKESPPKQSTKISNDNDDSDDDSDDGISPDPDLEQLATREQLATGGKKRRTRRNKKSKKARKSKKAKKSKKARKSKRRQHKK